ncbi:hypothetical protein T11_7692 [Trichinella zimbabwensis]|uniref:Uncharacterized protein n=1 Tax=Trichinella zimbabwensis TaxID=268475 RepID=A0A0V1HWS0_9BILA|nr:hypothetical protein T11_7692 [Trichinella zimbabwensis]
MPEKCMEKWTVMVLSTLTGPNSLSNAVFGRANAHYSNLSVEGESVEIQCYSTQISLDRAYDLIDNHDVSVLEISM